MAVHDEEALQKATIYGSQSSGESLARFSTRQRRIQSLAAVAADSHPETATEVSSGSKQFMEEPLATTMCLQNFGKVLERNKLRSHEIEDEMLRTKMMDETTANGHQPPNKTLAQLREWAQPTPKSFLQKALMPIFPGFGRPDRPRDKDLERLAHHYFPQRGDLKIRICDFGDGRVEYSESRLDDLENCTNIYMFGLSTLLIESAVLHEKPDWSLVRWM
jgi:hypothetical protein